ncbi:GTP-binding protein [Namhaeicola litoreus]|uniref:GTP-binding protein n=1 Tax=Namhaeicola litoreus TaxID=1052145 RepID=A0ABW3XX26_9FLAO
MNEPIHQENLNRVLLKPRFKIPVQDQPDNLSGKFKEVLKNDYPSYRGKVVGHHIVVDVPEKEETFWSPQLHAEIITEEEGVFVKGILGPKPKVWTFFMFLHFAVAVAFFVFFVIFYTNWSLGNDYTFAMWMCIVLPIIWVLLYFSGQLGKKFGYTQMQNLHDLMIEIIHK